MALALIGLAPARAQGSSASGAVAAPHGTRGRSHRASSRATTRETVDNPYGLGALWAQGDFVSRGTLIILVIMSMGSWYIIFTKLTSSLKLIRQAKPRQRRASGRRRSLRQRAQTLKEGSAFRFIAESGIERDRAPRGHAHRADRPQHLDHDERPARRRQLQSRLQDGLAFLATVGSTAPFVGLFGTVWGIYHALTAIGIAGQASIDKVAGPVGEALIMTAIGLAVAVPAVMGYNWLVRRNKVAMEAVRAFGADLHVRADGGARSAPGAAR